MGFDTSAASVILKEDYLPSIREQLNNKVLLWNRIQKNTEDFEGKRAYLPLHTTRNSGIGARDENAVLPDAGNQGYDVATWDMSYQYARIEVSGPVIARTKSDDGSWVRAFDSEIRGAVQDLTQDLARQCFGNRTGVLADPADGVTSTSHVVDSVRNLEVGEFIDFIQINDGSNLGLKRRITNIVNSTRTITVDAANTGATTANTRLVRNGNYGKEMFGLDAVINASNPTAIAGSPNLFGNIDRSAAGKQYWQANELDAGGVPVTLNLMQQAIDTADQQSNGEITLILTDYDQWRKYASILVPDRRFPTADGKPIKLDGGFQALMYDEIEVVKDRFAPPQILWFMDEATFMFFVMSDFDWMDKDGAVIARTPNKDAYEGTLFAYIQMGNEAPRSNTKLFNLAA